MPSPFRSTPPRIRGKWRLADVADEESHLEALGQLRQVRRDSEYAGRRDRAAPIVQRVVIVEASWRNCRPHCSNRRTRRGTAIPWEKRFSARTSKPRYVALPIPEVSEMGPSEQSALGSPAWASEQICNTGPRALEK